MVVKAHQTAALVSLNVGGISFKRQSMVCGGERERGRWEWGAGAMEPGREALAKTPAWLEGARRPPAGRRLDSICPGRALPLPTPPPPPGSLSCQLKPSFHLRIHSLPTASPAPPGKGGRTLHPAWRWGGGTGGDRGPGLALGRAAPALDHPPEKGVGRARFALNKREGGAPFAPGQSTRSPRFLFRKGGRRFSAPNRREPPRKRGPTSSSLRGRETKPLPLPPKKPASPT